MKDTVGVDVAASVPADEVALEARAVSGHAIATISAQSEMCRDFTLQVLLKVA